MSTLTEEQRVSILMCIGAPPNPYNYLGKGKLVSLGGEWGADWDAWYDSVKDTIHMLLPELNAEQLGNEVVFWMTWYRRQESEQARERIQTHYASRARKKV